MKRVLPLLLLWSTGCVNTVRFPPDLWRGQFIFTGDTGFFFENPTEPRIPQIARVFGSCEETTLRYTAITTAWITDGQIDFIGYDPLPRNEQHPMRLTEVDPEGRWDRWDVALRESEKPGEWTPGTTTAFTCDDLSSLTFAAVPRVADPSTSDLRSTDCVVWGSSPSTLATLVINTYADLTECREIL